VIEQLADLFPLILFSAVTALVSAPLVIRISSAVGLVDRPGSAPHKVHSSPTPLAGGPVLALSLAMAYAILRPATDREVVGILLGAGLLLIWGLLDDRVGLGPLQKLVGHFLVAFLLIYVGVQVQITRVVWLDIALTIFWIVGLINAYNFVDSMDGLALGLAGIAAAFFMLVTVDSRQPPLANLSAATFGAAMGAYYFNASPARMFLGDSGAQLLGFLLAAIGIAYVPAGAGLPQGVTWFTPILVMGVPIFDMTLVVVSRLLRRTPVHRAGRDHTYHRLLALGLDTTRSVLAMQLAAVVLGLTAFIALDASVITANLIFIAIALLGLVLLIYLQRATSVERT
jgi:UDP-GlcNAc:undecaprenyl-phosphate GlcNAc-1-phosphate transferase